MHMPIRRRLVASLVPVGAIIAVMALTTGAAQAVTPASAAGARSPLALSATSASPSTVTSTYHGGKDKAAATTISCSIVSFSPEFVGVNQTYFGITAAVDSVGGYATVSCTSNVASIEQITGVFWSGNEEGTGQGGSTGASNATVAAIAYCVPGDWYTSADALINFPPGFSPSQSAIAATSGTVNFSTVAC
jgi:hypothetical protein